jgi:2-oxoglutarate ferredoxin oxidoreductase subunit alpha
MQAEDELAAIGMAIGAGWSGIRAMTSTSGPGLSLMTEFAGLAYYTEVPVVVWDVQRIGPSTGLPTRTSQGDLTFTAFLGHGDTEQIILLPGDVYECFEFGWKAFDIAERMQAPVFVLSDLDMGMNQWMSKPFDYPDVPMDRGKILWEKDLEEIKENWGRYLDLDGDGIPSRTVPGNAHPLSSYLLSGTGHDEHARYTEEAPVWARNMERLNRKYDTAKQYLPKPVLRQTTGAKVGIIGFGSTEAAIEEARYQLEKEHGIKTDFMRVRAVPFTPEVDEFIQKHDRVYVVDLNRDGQMHQLLTISHPESAPKLVSIAFNDGLPATAKWIRESVLEKHQSMLQQKSEIRKQKANGNRLKAASASPSNKKVLLTKKGAKS